MPENIFIDPQVEASAPPQSGPVAPPTLTPMQQRFMGQLAAQPSGTHVYQPAQSFEDPAYQQKLYEWEQETRRTAEAARAEQAIQAGIRFIYQRRYDDDLKRGVPEQQAFSRMMMGIALHGPKTDPIKAFEAFRARPAPQAQMMRFGTNEVPVIINTDQRGAQRATPVPQSVLPKPPLGTDVTIFKHPVTGAELAAGIPTGPSSRQLVGKAEEFKEQPFKLAEFRKLLDREEEIEKDIQTYESFKDLEEEDKALLERRRADLKAVRERKAELNSGSTAKPTQASTNTVTRLTKDGRKAIFDAATKRFLRYAD